MQETNTPPRQTQTLFARFALLPNGWARDVRITLADAMIASLTAEATAQPQDITLDVVVPAMPNLHSHAFQRGVSGLSETRGPTADSFWTWRKLMYHFAQSITPEDNQALAAMAYIEMLEAGFARVGEFHYVHHDRDGHSYDNPAEMSEGLFAAAAETGIALTHLPVFYAHGGFGPQPIGAGQRRFCHDLDGFVALVAACDRALHRPQDRVGIAPHSLRAVTETELRGLLDALPGRPVHIHIAEQSAEVAQCLAHTGRRPVAWLLDELPVDERWCLIHATHMDAEETARLAASGAIAGLCPITEANLGDGLFPAPEYSAAGGGFGVGTDSNIRIDLAEELRVLEYGQRLTHQARNVLSAPGQATASWLYQRSLVGGAQALDAPKPRLAVDAPADLLALSDPLGEMMTGDDMLSRFVFGRDVQPCHVWAHGRLVVQNGQHILRDAVMARYRTTLHRILSRLTD